MLFHELRQHILLLLLITTGLPLALHLLIIHHLLDHAARLAVQLRQLRVLRLDFLHVDLGCGRDDVGPPRRARGFGERDDDFFAAVRKRGERPRRVIDVDWVREGAL